MVNEDNEYYYITFIFLLVSFVLGMVATRLGDWLIERKEKRRINQIFIDFFNSFTLLETPLKARMKAMVLLQRMGNDLILEKLCMMYNQHYRTQQTLEETTIIEKSVQNLSIRLDNESWHISMVLSAMYIIDTTKSIEDNQFRFIKETIDPKSNENTLIDFLKFLQETYRNIGIIKKSKRLVNGKLTLKIKEEMKKVREK